MAGMLEIVASSLGRQMLGSSPALRVQSSSIATMECIFTSGTRTRHLLPVVSERVCFSGHTSAAERALNGRCGPRFPDRAAGLSFPAPSIPGCWPVEPAISSDLAGRTWRGLPAEPLHLNGRFGHQTRNQSANPIGDPIKVGGIAAEDGDANIHGRSLATAIDGCRHGNKFIAGRRHIPTVEEML